MSIPIILIVFLTGFAIIMWRLDVFVWDKLFAPKKVPELSCFVKGVIKSMETEPEKWKQRFGAYSDAEFWTQNEVTIWAPDTFALASIGGHSTTKTERRALTTAFNQYLKPIPEREEAARLAAIRAPFEKLGCPDKE